MRPPVGIRIRRQRLGVDAPSGAREQRLIQVAQEALDDPILHVINVAGTSLRGLGARFPEVAQALIRLYRAGSQASAEEENFAIRFNSAPLLSQMLQEVLNRLTGLRSGVEIIGGAEEISGADHRHFIGAVMHDAGAGRAFRPSGGAAQKHLGATPD